MFRHSEKMRVSRMCNMNMMVTLILLQAGGSPWENAVQQLQNAFTGPIAKGLSLVAIVVGGLMFAFGEGGNKRMFAGIVFGIGMAICVLERLQILNRMSHFQIATECVCKLHLARCLALYLEQSRAGDDH